MKKIKFKTNINCNNCIRSVTPFLNGVDTVEEWSVDIDNPEKILTVEMDGGSEVEVIQAVTKAGFEIKTA